MRTRSDNTPKPSLWETARENIRGFFHEVLKIALAYGVIFTVVLGVDALSRMAP